MDGSRFVTIFKQSGEPYLPEVKSAPLPVWEGSQPSIIATEDSVDILYFGDALLYYFAPDASGTWRLAAVQGAHSYRCTAYWLIELDIPDERRIAAADTTVALAQFVPTSYPPEFDALAETLNTDGVCPGEQPRPRG